MGLTCVEVCAGLGGQALGLEQAGFGHQAVVEIDQWACASLRLNRGTSWDIVEQDLRTWSGRPFEGVDLLAGGVPCPPFSKAGKQLGADDDRDLFPTAIRLVDEIRPRGIILENVKGILDATFDGYRTNLNNQLYALGYTPLWKLLTASDFGVSQLRPRVVLVALKHDVADNFTWPEAHAAPPPTVGELLLDLMQADGWEGASAWAAQANDIAPTLVGGSKKHGGPDLGPTRARKAWAALGVEGRTLANEPPAADFQGMPRLTVRMAARVQGIPDSWQIAGKKTNAYRQVGNAFPPPVACAVAQQVSKALTTQKIFAAS